MSKKLTPYSQESSTPMPPELLRILQNAKSAELYCSEIDQCSFGPTVNIGSAGISGGLQISRTVSQTVHIKLSK